MHLSYIETTYYPQFLQYTVAPVATLQVALSGVEGKRAATRPTGYGGSARLAQFLPSLGCQSCRRDMSVE